MYCHDDKAYEKHLKLSCNITKYSKQNGKPMNINKFRHLNHNNLRKNYFTVILFAEKRYNSFINAFVKYFRHVLSKDF